jgi:rubrerythrin
MSFISNNAYRVLGVCSNASLKDIQKNISQLKAFAKIGKEMDLGYNLSFLNLAKIDRKDDLLLRSENQLNLDKNKITSSLFWFADLSPIDAVALAHLIKADVSKAIEIWDKATTSKEVSLNNYSAFNNLSTLLLLSTLDDSKTDTFKKDTDSIKQIKKAIKLKNEFISSTFFNNYCESISKSTPLSSDAAQDFFTNTILDLFNKNFSTKELSDLFEGLDDKLKDTLNASLTEAPISNIKNHIETASELIKKNEKSGIKVGKQLIKDTLKDIKYLKEIFSQDDFQFQTLSDKLSNLILQCGIVCFNKTGDDQDYLTSYQYALSIAIDEKAKERAKDCIKHCKEQKEANICKFCNQNEISSNSSFRIEMHKMTGYNSYTYFKDGGIEVSCCNSCSGQKSQKNVIALGWSSGLNLWLAFNY